MTSHLQSALTDHFQELFARQKRQIDTFFSHFDLSQMDGVLQLCESCRGHLVFTGVGKSGIIAEKIAKTMTSTGTRAIHLSAVDALHGDAGILQAGDVLFVLSKSGQTEELADVIRIARLKRVTVVGWFCSESAGLADVCDHVVQLPLEKELCPFDLAPTTSTSLQLILGDVLAVALMRQKGFSLDEYAINHSSGSIGKKTTLRVEDVMLRGERLPVCREGESVSDILVELTNKRCGCVLVVDESGALQGIFTDGDLRRALQKHGERLFAMEIGSLMTREFLSITSKAMLVDAAEIMQVKPDKRVMMLPVIDDGAVVGLVTMHDVVTAGI